MDMMSMGTGMNMPMYGTMNGMGAVDPSMTGYGAVNALGAYGSTGIGPTGFLTILFGFAFKVFIIVSVIGLITWYIKGKGNQFFSITKINVCPNCKGKIQSDFSYCPNCQAEIKKVVPAVINSQPVA